MKKPEIRSLPTRASILGIAIDPWSMEQTVGKIVDLASRRVFAHVIGVNADKVLQVRDNDAIAQIVRACEIVNADGASMVIASKLLGSKLPERVAGIDLMQKVCDAAARSNLPVYLLGAKPSVVERTKSNLIARTPGLIVAGYRDGYFQDSDVTQIGNDIIKSEARIVFVGITSPRKELVIEMFRDQGVNSVYIGVGGSFDVISGLITRAPIWVQKMNLEWAFRVIQEPKRLYKRYLIGNIKFSIILAQEMLSRFLGK